MKKLSALRNKKGFTLVELVVVMVIIAILAAALVTSLVGYINKAKESNALVEAHNVYIAAQAFISEETGKGTAVGQTLTGVSDQDAYQFTGMCAAINSYVGKDGLVGEGDFKFTTDSLGTLTTWKYKASNNMIVTMDDQGNWTVATTDSGT